MMQLSLLFVSVLCCLCHDAAVIVVCVSAMMQLSLLSVSAMSMMQLSLLSVSAL